MSEPRISSAQAPGRSPEDVRAAVADALGTGAAAVSVTGAPGAGKTALCRALGDAADDRTFTAVVTDPAIGPDALLLQLINDFGLSAGPPAAGTQQLDALLGVVARFLKSLKPLGAHALVVIDDADRVGVDVLETLVRMGRAAGPDGRPLRLVLVGGGDLDARLLQPPLSEFPVAGSRWTRVGFSTDDALVPELPTDSTYVAAIEPDSEARPSAATSPRFLGLVAALLLVAAGTWWWTQRTSGGGPPGGRPTAPGGAQAGTPPAPPRSAPAGAPRTSVPAGAPAESRSADSGGSTPAPATSAPPAAPASVGGTPAAAPTTSTATLPAAPTDAAGSQSSPPAPGTFRITVASFRTAGRAQQIAAELQKHQLTVFTRTDASSTWHQVLAGPYPSIETAREAQRLLEQAGFPDTQISVVPPPAR